MLSLRLDEILLEKGKTAYWLAKESGITQNQISKMRNGETTMIRFDNLEKICITLDCSINDLFETDNPQLRRLIAYSSKINNMKSNKSDTE